MRLRLWLKSFQETLPKVNVAASSACNDSSCFFCRMKLRQKKQCLATLEIAMLGRSQQRAERAAAAVPAKVLNHFLQQQRLPTAPVSPVPTAKVPYDTCELMSLRLGRNKLVPRFDGPTEHAMHSTCFGSMWRWCNQICNTRNTFCLTHSY